jgi:hypothetical protein
VHFVSFTGSLPYSLGGVRRAMATSEQITYNKGLAYGNDQKQHDGF